MTPHGKEISSTVEALATTTGSKDPGSNEPTAARANKQSECASENVAPLHNNDESAVEAPSLPFSSDEPISQEAPESELAETPSIAALSVDNEERDDDSALGDPSM
jgi:hypothetical protein